MTDTVDPEEELYALREQVSWPPRWPEGIGHDWTKPSDKPYSSRHRTKFRWPWQKKPEEEQ